MSKVTKLDIYLSRLSIDRGWNPNDDGAIHHPNGEFIQIDMEELFLVRKLMKHNKLSYLQCAMMMGIRIKESLENDNKLNYYKDIEIQFFDFTDGKRYYTLIL